MRREINSIENEHNGENQWNQKMVLWKIHKTDKTLDKKKIDNKKSFLLGHS